MMKFEQDEDEHDHDQEGESFSELTDDVVIKLRGLPWSCTVDDIVEFFTDINICDGKNGVHLVTTSEGRSSGEAFVEFGTDDDLNLALKKDKKSMGHRYIEVFKVKRAEMDWVLKRNRPLNTNNGTQFRVGEDCDRFVRLRGLPFECTKEDIIQFFGGLEIVPNGIQLMVDGMGRSSGESYVQFTSKDMAEKALSKDRQCIGHRYIEVFRVGAAELRSIEMLVSRGRPNPYGGRPSPYDRGDRGGGGPNGGNQRYGGQRPARYFSKDSWNSYANEVGSWSRINQPPPPPPPPLIPGLKRSSHSNSAYSVLMRGLPFRASEDDIRKFFDPLVPTGINILFDASGRPSGTAKVQFASTEDVSRAMGKHKERMEHRYIELFVNSN